MSYPARAEGLVNSTITITISKSDDQSPKVHGRHQTLCKKRKRFENPNSGSENIKSRDRDGIWHRKMRHTDNEMRETIHDGWNGTTKLRKN